jgi:hypothetical protein
MQNFKKWIENFWYHYKWQTVLVVSFLTFIIIAVTQMATKDKIDVNVFYTGPYVFSPREIGQVEEAYEAMMSIDYNGDGEKGAEFTNIVLLTEEQVKQVREASKSGGNSPDIVDDIVIDANALREAENVFNQQIFAGQVLVCMMDPYWYNEVKKAGGWCKLTDVLGYRPEFAVDDFSVLLKDMKFAQYFKVFARLPEDTVLALRTISTVSSFTHKEKEQERWGWNAEMMRDLFLFEFPEGYDPEALEYDPGTEAAAAPAG